MNSVIQEPTVFIVDDDQAVRDSLVYFLEFEGMNVETYASAQEFLDSVRSSWSGCLLLDVSMPDMSGLELQQVLDEMDLKIPIIFITGHGDVPMSVKALKAGAVDFIEKPFDNEALLRNIKAVMFTEHSRQQAGEGNSDEATVNVAESVVETMRLPFLVLDENLHIVSTNRSFFELFEVSTHGNEAILLEEFSHCLWKIPQLRERLELVINNNVELRNLEVMIDSPSIGRMALLINARQIQQSSVLPKRLILVVEDVSQRKWEEEMIFMEKERAEITLDSIEEAVITTNARGEVIHLNPVAEKLMEWSASEARGQMIDKIIRMKDENTEESIADPVFLCLRQLKTIKLSEPAQLISRNGKKVFIDSTASPIHDKDGTVLGAVLVLKDVTEQRLINADLVFAASHDHLTGLVNRREFEKRLQRAIDSFTAQGSHHTLCFIDLDKFKVINDTVGHAAGDELLRQVTTIFQKKLRDRDTLARLGGDEFGLLFENCTLNKATEITEVMVEEISDYEFSWGGRSFKIGASVGLVSITSETKSPSDLLSQADVACYGAKRRGRSCVHIFQNKDKEHHGSVNQ